MHLSIDESREKFALYGFEMLVPRDWRLELNPKATRAKGDLVFHSPKENRFYVSWGEMSELEGRFKSLQEHRDKNIKQIQSGPDVKTVNVSDSYEERVSGHTALFSKVSADVKAGMFSRQVLERNMWSMHIYCEEGSRYYVIYCLLRDTAEYSDFGAAFKSWARTLVCH